MGPYREPAARPEPPPPAPPARRSWKRFRRPLLYAAVVIIGVPVMQDAFIDTFARHPFVATIFLYGVLLNVAKWLWRLWVCTARGGRIEKQRLRRIRRGCRRWKAEGQLCQTASYAHECNGCRVRLR